MARTFYEVLGVPEDASQAAIRDAYRRAVKECHPDVSDDPDAGDRFKRVTRAEEVLGDPAEREKYDRLGHDAYVGRIRRRNASGSESSPWTGGDRRRPGHDAGGFDPREAARDAREESETADADASRGSATEAGENRASSSVGFGPGATRQQSTDGATTTADGGYSVHDWDDDERWWDDPEITLVHKYLLLAGIVVAILLLLVWIAVIPLFGL